MKYNSVLADRLGCLYDTIVVINLKGALPFVQDKRYDSITDTRVELGQT